MSDRTASTAQPDHATTCLLKPCIIVPLGFLAFVLIKLLLSKFSLSSFEANLLAAIGACSMGLFLVRERYLCGELKAAKSEYTKQISCLLQRVNAIETSQAICAVTVDMATLQLQRASSAFYDLCEVDAATDLSQLYLDTLLKIDANWLRHFLNGLNKNLSDAEAAVAAVSPNGSALRLRISGRKYVDSEGAELVLFNLPNSAEELSERQEILNELERYSKGLLRRETRILELKREVNQLLTGAGQTVRYQVDSVSQETAIDPMLSGSSARDA
ncbi:MAG: hypothetical protein ACPGCT_02200 [Opitutales bacterium]